MANLKIQLLLTLAAGALVALACGGSSDGSSRADAERTGCEAFLELTDLYERVGRRLPAAPPELRELEAAALRSNDDRLTDASLRLRDAVTNHADAVEGLSAAAPPSDDGYRDPFDPHFQAAERRYRAASDELVAAGVAVDDACQAANAYPEES